MWSPLRLFRASAAAGVGGIGCGAVRSLSPSAAALTIGVPGAGSRAPELDRGAAAGRTLVRRPRP